MTRDAKTLHRPALHLLALAMVAAFVTIEAEPAQASFPGGNGRIVFSSLTSEDIVSVNADGTGRRTVLSYGGSPTYSPDGRVRQGLHP